ncbi:SRPBCC family protein [Desulfocurvus sp. DL9XJH121]
MNSPSARRFARATPIVLAAPPAAVFPLLCPTREYDWIPHWQCDLRHSDSGFAERDCVFETDFPGRGREVWVCTRHEPPRQVEYVRWSSLGLLRRLTLTLLDHGDGGTAIVWEVAATALTPSGETLLDELAHGGYQEEVEGIARMLSHYLQTGTMTAPRA